MRVYKFLDEEFGRKSLKQKRLKISRIEDLNDPFELLPYDHTQPDLRYAFLKTRDDMAEDRGVVCFSASWSDPVIWAHYSEKHRGMCLGFDIPEIDENSADEIMRVKYEANPLPFPPNYLDLSAQQSSVIVRKVLSTKFENWKYEKEIRMWVQLQRQEKDGELYFLHFGGKLQLAEVVLGVRCKISKGAILDELGSAVKEVNVRRARAAHSTFEMVDDDDLY